MAGLFENTSILGMKLANRFVRSATWEGLADKEGHVTARFTEMMVELAREKVGLIISSFASVSPAGRSGPRQLAVYDDTFLPGLKEMVRAVHAAGGKIALQIAHGGCLALSKLTGVEAIGPSEREKNGHPLCRSASREDIDGIISSFIQAAARAKEAGFDAVQIHAAHGYLLSQFLSPAFNRRTDEYGGSLENRARILLEVVQWIRKVVGPDYPLLVKLNSEDFLEGGLTCEEAVEVAVMLERASINAIELSGGTLDSPKKLSPVRPVNPQSEEDEAYYREAVSQFKQRLTIPLMLVGGIRSLAVAKRLVQGNAADYISLSRPFVCEPGLVNRWQKGDQRISACISCNGCFVPALEGRGISCTAKAGKKEAGKP
jgi:2,4-dienoyl-CoA reductase-like NADH-dependent reductase (Old Yellow Enzyme family)